MQTASATGDGRRSAKRTLAALTVSVLALFAIGWYLNRIACGYVPSTAYLVRDFPRIHKTLDRLAAMMQEDKKVMAVGASERAPEDWHELPYGSERWKQYEPLMKEADVRVGLSKERPHVIAIWMSSVDGIIVGGRIGYAYSKEIPPGLVPDLDKAKPPPGGGVQFQRIEGYWFVIREVNDN